MAEQQPPRQPPTQDEVLRSFKDSLADAVAIVEKLVPVCGSVDDLVGVLKFALNNDGQLRLLLKEISPLSKR